MENETLTTHRHNKVTTICGKGRGRRAEPKSKALTPYRERKYGILFSLTIMDIYIQMHLSTTIIQILSPTIIHIKSKLLL